MGKIGFDINNEFLPSFDKFQTMVNRRLMFLKLFNQEVSCDMKFSKEEIKECRRETLFNIFAKKIINNIQFSPYRDSKLMKVDVNLTIKVNSFLKKLELAIKRDIAFHFLRI